MSITPVDTITVKEVVSPVSTITNIERKKEGVGRKKGCKLDLESLESGGVGKRKSKKNEHKWKYFLEDEDDDETASSSSSSFSNYVLEEDEYLEYDEIEENLDIDLEVQDDQSLFIPSTPAKTATNPQGNSQKIF